MTLVLAKEYDFSLRYLLAVSGGMDSMVLWHYWHTKGYRYGVVHCNFGLRGQESEDDEQFVRQIAQQRNIPIWSKKFSTLEYAQQHRLSVQEAARILRYAYFEEIRKNYGFDYILTAHHADDQLETVIYRLIKGTSLIGLRGMKIQNGFIERPFLNVSRSEIEEYAKTHQVTWREDSSNHSDKYARNFIRHHIIPLGKQLNPRWEKTFSKTAEKLLAVENILQEYIQNIQNQYTTQKDDQLIIHKSILKIRQAAFVLSELLKPYGFDDAQVQRLAEANLRTGKQLFSKTHILHVDRDTWVVCPQKTSQPLYITLRGDEKEILLNNQHISICVREYNEILKKEFALHKQNPNNWTAYFDAEKLQFPLTMRRWQAGDRMQVIGLKGRKKVSDILTDEKVSPQKKSNIFVVLSNKEIIWLVGFRIAEKAKVSEQTRQICKISIENDENSNWHAQ